MANRLLNIDTEKIFKVKQKEIKLVSLLFMHNFFHGFGLALFFTAANAIFLSSFSVSKLPLVYIFSGFVLLMSGSIYSYFEARISHKALLRGSLILIFAIALLMWFGASLVKVAWFAFFILILYKVVNLLGNLEFWGLTSLLLDVRQSKRLFGIISSGEVIAKLIGYLSVPMMVRVVGNNNLIIIASVSFFICIYFYNRVLKHNPKKETGKNLVPTREMQETQDQGFLKKFFKSDFIVLLAILSFLSILAFTFIDFTFMTNVQQAYPTKEQIAVFFGLFYGFAKGITFVVKFFLSGRLIDLLGVKRSLLLLPILFLLIILAIVFVNLTRQFNQYYIFLFGFLMLTSEILRFSLHEPVFFSLFQPLNQKLRLFGQAVVNGLLNPIALGIAGLFIFLLIKYTDTVDLNLVSYILLLILVGWVIVVILANRQYIMVLQNAVKKRYFEGSEIALKGKVVLNILKSKLESEYPEEVIYSTELILKQDPGSKEQILSKLLTHSHEEVQLYVIQKIEELKLKKLKDEINLIIFSDYSDEVRQAAIKTYCMLDEQAIEKILALLDSDNKALRLGATTGLLKSGGLEAVGMAGQKIVELTECANVADNVI